MAVVKGLIKNVVSKATNSKQTVKGGFGNRFLQHAKTTKSIKFYKCKRTEKDVTPKFACAGAKSFKFAFKWL